MSDARRHATSVTPAYKTLTRLAILACLVGLALPAATAGAASKATPCWKTLITDWYDGRIDHSYPIHCYRDALKHLPTDVRTYSDAYDVISRALASATRGKKHVNQNAIIPPPANSGGGPGGGSSGGGHSGGGGPSIGGGTGTTKGPNQGGGAATGTGSGFLNQAANSLGSDHADTVPIPLLVLAGLAVLLVAAGGAGLLARRLQGRRAGH
jgi:hypothetical protein